MDERPDNLSQPDRVFTLAERGICSGRQKRVHAAAASAQQGRYSAERPKAFRKAAHAGPVRPPARRQRWHHQSLSALRECQVHQLNSPSSAVLSGHHQGLHGKGVPVRGAIRCNGKHSQVARATRTNGIVQRDCAGQVTAAMYPHQRRRIGGTVAWRMQAYANFAATEILRRPSNAGLAVSSNGSLPGVAHSLAHVFWQAKRQCALVKQCITTHHSFAG